MKRPMILCSGVAVIISLMSLRVNSNIMLMVMAFEICLFIISVRLTKSVNFAVIFAICTIIALSSFLQILKAEKTENCYGRNDRIKFTVEESNADDYYITAKVKEGRVCCKNTKISLYTGGTCFKTGDLVTADITYKKFDEKNFSQFAEKIFITGKIQSVEEKTHTNSVAAFLFELRSKISERLYENIDYKAASTLEAITVGEKYRQTDDFAQNVRACGVSHVLVVSGMHLAIICGTFYKISRAVLRNKRVAAISTLVAVVFFMALCGFTHSVVRAGITYLIMLFGIMMLRWSDPLNSLCTAVTLMIIINPFCMGSIAFILSVTSTAGIIVLSPIIMRFIKADRIKFLPLKIVIQIVITTVAALIATFPVTVYYFSGISLVSIPVNILVCYSVTFSLIFAALALGLSFIGLPLLAVPFYKGAEITALYFNRVIDVFAGFKYSYINVNVPLTLVLYFVVAFLFVLKYTNICKKLKLRRKSNADSI